MTSGASIKPVLFAVAVLIAAFIDWRWYASRSEVVATPDVAEEPLEAESSELVLIMVSTTPPGAAVYANDVLAERNPVELPMSSKPVKIRVEAKGYASKTIEVVPERSRRVEISLDRK